MRKTEKESRLAELLNLERLQSLQDNLSKALGLAFTTVDYRGRTVMENSGFTDFCSCIRKHGKYGHLCNQCYAHAGLHATMEGKPYVYRCHAGLVEFAVPLMVDGKYMGAVMGGQCQLEGESPDLDPVLPHRTPWEEDAALVSARSSVHSTTYEKLEAGICLVWDIVQNLLEEERSRVTQEELERKSRELMEEKAARFNLELSMQEEASSDSIAERLDAETLFYMLNVISRLAFLENAEETERTACDFASMMRYLLENGEYHCVTLGEELEYIDYYLQVQRRRMEGRLRYEITVPEKYYSTLCPFMLLRPLVKNTVKCVLESSREGGGLRIDAREEKNLLVLAIRGDCTGRMLDIEGKQEESSLYRMDKSLKRIFGPDCGVSARSPEKGLSGTEIQVRLPLQSTPLER